MKRKDKNDKKSVLSIMVTIFQIIIGVLFSFFISSFITVRINESKTLNDAVFLLSFFAVFAVILTVYIYAFVIVSIKNSKNKLLHFFDNHRLEIALVFLMIWFIFVSIINKSQYDEQRTQELINIEWIIFGITVTFYSIWHVFYLSKGRQSINNPNNMIGSDRINEILKIKGVLAENKIITMSNASMALNVTLLSLITTAFYISSVTVASIRVLSIISFYVDILTMILVFFETIEPVVNLKKEYEDRVKNFNLDISSEILSESVIEDITATIANSILDPLEENNSKKEKILDNFKKKLINSRKKDSNHLK